MNLSATLCVLCGLFAFNLYTSHFAIFAPLRDLFYILCGPPRLCGLLFFLYHREHSGTSPTQRFTNLLFAVLCVLCGLLFFSPQRTQKRFALHRDF